MALPWDFSMYPTTPEPENKSMAVSKSNCEATAQISAKSLFFDPIKRVGGYRKACWGSGGGTNCRLKRCLGGTVTITSSPVRPVPWQEI